jgi:hypothetical protein
MDNIEETLLELPERIQKALMNWEEAILKLEEKEAKLFLEFKEEDPSRLPGEIKARIALNKERHDLRMMESTAKANYKAVYETLMAAKRRASLRTAF